MMCYVLIFRQHNHKVSSKTTGCSGKSGDGLRGTGPPEPRTLPSMTDVDQLHRAMEDSVQCHGHSCLICYWDLTCGVHSQSFSSTSVLLTCLWNAFPWLILAGTLSLTEGFADGQRGSQSQEGIMIAWLR